MRVRQVGRGIALRLGPQRVGDRYRKKITAAATGEGVTVAVRKAAEERLLRVRRDKAGRRLADDLLAIGARCAALPDLDTRSAEEVLGYDENGLPT